MTADLTARIAEASAFIKQHLAVDEECADELHNRFYCNLTALQQFGECSCGHPAHTLRRVRATRDLVAAILAEGHYYDGVGYYSCSQAREGFGLASGLTGPPGSGCADPERAGKPCDCGRDAKVARLLGIIAGEWEADGHER